jgi:hypothetical protein
MPTSIIVEEIPSRKVGVKNYKKQEMKRVRQLLTEHTPN